MSDAEMANALRLRGWTCQPPWQARAGDWCVPALAVAAGVISAGFIWQNEIMAFIGIGIWGVAGYLALTLP